MQKPHAAAVVLAIVLALAPVPAAALDAVAVRAEDARISLAGALERRPDAGRSLRLETEGGPALEARASPSNPSPGWLVFALANEGATPLTRWLVLENTGSADSGFLMPVLGGPRLAALTASGGPQPRVRALGREDIFELTLPPGEVVTFIAETRGPPPGELHLWREAAYRENVRALSFYDGLLVGIVGLLAIFLSSLFVVRRRMMYPAAACIGWAALALLGGEFGLWQSGLGVAGGLGIGLRAASEALFAGGFAFLLYTFLDLQTRRAVYANAALAAMAAALLAIVVSLVFPTVGASIARVLMVLVAVLGAVLIVILVLGGSGRAMSLSPAWIVFVVHAGLAGLIFSGAVASDIGRPLFAAMLVIVVMIVAFTVMQYAFATDVTGETERSDLGYKAVAFAATGLAVWDWDVADETIHVGREVEAALGLERESLRGDQDHWLGQVHQLDRDRFVQEANGAVQRPDGVLDTELRLRTASGGLRWYRLRARAVAREGNRATRFIGGLEDITAARMSRDRLLRDAVQDSLTGLPNRALFIDRLKRAITRAEGGSKAVRPPSVIVIDIDRFKAVNETFGHAVGDSILTILAQRLSELVDPQDTLGRIQGDQFAVAITTLGRHEDVVALATDLSEALKQPIYVGDQEVFLVGSFGVASYAADRHDNAEDLIREAELAMVHAKSSGQPGVVSYEPSMQSARSDRLSLESDLRRAIEREEIEMLYQPIVSLADERIAGFEALMRWHHPEQGELSPDDFIEIAEQSGTIVELGHFAIDAATRQLAIWRRTFSDVEHLFVSVNVSSRQIFRQDLMRDVRLVITRADIPAGALRLEITESLVMENPELAAYVLERLSAMGAGLALDDFGTGYSALSYLQRFPFDTVKVDKSLVTGQDGNASVILRSIVNMAHDLNMRVVAEGVESAEDVAFLRQIGCEYGQGYHYSPPLTVTEAMQFLTEWR